MSTMVLQGKVALVTGAARGIGRAIALELAKAGADIAFTDFSAVEECKSLVAEITAMGRRALSIQADASLTAQAAEVVQNVLKEFGKLDILVNNVGITKDTLLLRMTEEDWDRVITTNLKSVFNYTKAAIKPMMGQQSGKIINMSSIIGVIGGAGQANYSASKAGIIGFTKSTAKEMASRNIQVNAVAPGFVETAMTEKLNDKQKEAILAIIPMKRTAKPAEIAGVVLFLASAASDYLTGQTLCVDGGLVM